MSVLMSRYLAVLTFVVLPFAPIFSPEVDCPEGYVCTQSGTVV